MAYDFDGKSYGSASAHQKEWGSNVITEMAFQGNERVLDLGCGDGLLTSRIAELVPDGEVVGIDGSRGMIAVASENQRPNLRFLLLDINDIAFEDDFDVIFSNAALHWIKNHRKLLANVRRALRRGGRVRFNFAADGNCSHFFKVVREAMTLDGFKRYFEEYEWPWYMPSLDEYESLVAESGLEAKVWGENADRFFADEDTMVRWIDQPSLVPFLCAIDDGDREAFRSHVIGRMIEETRQGDGTCFETFRRINVQAQK